MLYTVADCERERYEIERSTIQGRWRLIGADKLSAKHADGSMGFTPKEAMAFLERQTDLLPQ